MSVIFTQKRPKRPKKNSKHLPSKIYATIKNNKTKQDLTRPRRPKKTIQTSHKVWLDIIRKTTRPFTRPCLTLLQNQRFPNKAIQDGKVNKSRKHIRPRRGIQDHKRSFLTILNQIRPKRSYNTTQGYTRPKKSMENKRWLLKASKARKRPFRNKNAIKTEEQWKSNYKIIIYQKPQKTNSSNKIHKTKNTHSIKINRPGHNIRMYWTNFWQPTVHVEQYIFEKKLLEKLVAHIFTLLLAPFASKLVNYSRHSET